MIKRLDLYICAPVGTETSTASYCTWNGEQCQSNICRKTKKVYFSSWVGFQWLESSQNVPCHNIRSTYRYMYQIMPSVIVLVAKPLVETCFLNDDRYLSMIDIHIFWECNTWPLPDPSYLYIPQNAYILRKQPKGENTNMNNL